MKDKNKTIIIQGVTASGETFRPSNWAERMSGKLSTFEKHRIKYSPLLKPMTRDGYKCIVLDPKLRQLNPELFSSIMKFAESHQLTICGEDNPKDNLDADTES
jgi:hypothetical protein